MRRLHPRPETEVSELDPWNLQAGWRRRVFLGLGANLGPDPAQSLRAALAALDREKGLRVIRCSRFFRTPPWGPIAQPDYINAVAEVATVLPGAELLGRLLGVERDMGRRREGPRFGPRVIDLDLLLDGDAVISAPGLTVPHPRLAERAFVLVPLAELDPDLAVPGFGPLRTLLEALGPESTRLQPAETG